MTSRGPGAWTVTAGERGGRLHPSSERVELGGPEAEVDLDLAANPTWNPDVRIRIRGGSEEEAPRPLEGTFRVITSDGVVEAPFTPGEGIHVPGEGPFAVEYDEGFGRSARAVLDGPPRGGGPALILPPPEEEPAPAPATPEVPEARLTVLLPDGSPAAGALITVTPREATGWTPSWSKDLDEEGSLEVALAPGDRIQVVVWPGEGQENVWLVPLEARIEGPGPWTFRWPAVPEGPGPWSRRWISTEIDVRALDEKGTPVPEFSVLPDPTLVGVDAIDGVVRLLGASPGPLRVWVNAPGRRTHSLRLVVAGGERREVIVRMRPR
jgi:hypothetical protein